MSKVKIDENEVKQVAFSIMEEIENLLDSKDISIPCADADEERERGLDGNEARLYGMEYAAIYDTVEFYLTNLLKAHGVLCEEV